MKFDGENVTNYLAVGIPSFYNVEILEWTTVGGMLSAIGLVKAYDLI